MMVIPEPIITVLFQRGEFTADDAYQTGMALRGFALGLPGYVIDQGAATRFLCP